jgi:hypothetical protein
MAVLRHTVRLKIDDDADLQLVLDAIDEAAAFVANVHELARATRVHPAAMLADVLAHNVATESHSTVIPRQ